MNFADHGGFALQIAGMGNITIAGLSGIQLTFLVNHVRYSYDGLQIGLFNWNNFLITEWSSWTVGNVRYTRVKSKHWRGTSHGVQISAGNVSYNYGGIQIGAVSNVVKNSLSGVQLSMPSVSRACRSASSTSPPRTSCR